MLPAVCNCVCTVVAAGRPGGQCGADNARAAGPADHRARRVRHRTRAAGRAYTGNKGSAATNKLLQHSFSSERNHTSC